MIRIISIYLLIMAFLVGMYTQRFLLKQEGDSGTAAETEDPGVDLTKLGEEVLPGSGYTFNIKWGALGKKLVDDGVIDKVKLAKAVTGQEELPPQLDKYLDGSNQEQIELSQSNAHFWVDVLWGLGLANKNNLLDSGPISEGGNAANYASTGGWTLGKEDAMKYFSKYSYITLDSKQQVLVEEIAGSIYRPCCGNSTAFPDCNHGMALLALIELMVAQGFSKDEIYKTSLAFNSYWFPQTYLDISYHFAKNGRDYKNVAPSEILSKTFSSSSGYQAVKSQIGDVEWPALKRSGGGCGA